MWRHQRISGGVASAKRGESSSGSWWAAKYKYRQWHGVMLQRKRHRSIIVSEMISMAARHRNVNGKIS